MSKKNNARNNKIPEYVNETVNKKGLGNLLAEVFENYGNATTARFANNLKDLGYKYATKASVTLSIDDLSVPPKKAEFVKQAEDELHNTHERFERGEITEVERYNKVIDTWSETTEKVTEAVVDNFDRLNPVYMMAFSGARGNISQVRQLVGMRGLMADSEGKIIDLPIKSNFREGLSVTEYIISAYGARKGLVDTALKTADSGYLTRRLVDVAQDVIIRDVDCGTKKYVEMKPLMDGEAIGIGIGPRILGRHAAETVKDSEGNTLVKKGGLINRQIAKAIEDAGVQSVKIRSVMTCESKYGVCQQCYGWATTTNSLVNLGEAIGIIAAQSIGEPGTQLTMRTFHTGGAVAGSGQVKEVYTAPCDGTVEYSIPAKEIRTKYGDVMQQTTKDGKLTIGSKSIKVLTGAELSVKPGDKVKEGAFLGNAPELSKKKILTEKATKDVITTQSGIASFEDFGVEETTDRQGNISKQANKQGTIWVSAGEVLPLPASGTIVVEKGKQVKQGDVLSETIIKCEHGGEVRFGKDVLIEKANIGAREVNQLVRGRLVNVINASIGCANGHIEQTQQGNNIWVLDDESERYVVKVVQGEMIESGKIIAELIEDKKTPAVNCSGEVIFDGLEIDERKIVTKAGNVIFVPEEVHTVSKDASLVNSQTGDVVEAGFEIVKDVFTTIGGVVNITIDNNIVHDVTITPGELFEIKNLDDLKYQDGDIIKKSGIEVMPGVKTKKPSMVTLFTNNETGETKLLLREVQVFKIEPREVNFEGETTDVDISILPITQMNFKHGDRVRNISGGALNKTSLILYTKGNYKESKSLIEFSKDDLNIIFQENIILRSDRLSTSITEVVVKPGQYVKAGEPIAKTQTIAKSEGEVFIGENDNTRILVMTEHDTFTLDCSAAPKVKPGDYVRAGDKLDKSTVAEQSGCVISVDGKKLHIRKARPFLISANTRLQVDDNALVQQGDPLATIIYEKIKSGDIVQGLPKVEELLEGRKPKDPATMTDIEGKIEIVTDEVGSETVFVCKDDIRKEFVIPPGQNVIVNDGDEVQVGDMLTDGQPNPHEVLEFKGVEALRQFLVDEVQAVYNSQGVEISNKHLEVIVRQMTRKVRIDDPGETVLLQGELVDVNHFNHVNQEIEAIGQSTAGGTPVLLGLTKASLNTESFISAASFQETTRILAEGAIKGKSDWLYGLKENVIIGRLIPAGTGFDEEEDSDVALASLATTQEEEEGLLETAAS